VSATLGGGQGWLDLIGQFVQGLFVFTRGREATESESDKMASDKYEEERAANEKQWRYDYIRQNGRTPEQDRVNNPWSKEPMFTDDPDPEPDPPQGGNMTQMIMMMMLLGGGGAMAGGASGGMLGLMMALMMGGGNFFGTSDAPPELPPYESPTLSPKEDDGQPPGNVMGGPATN
jgi:hypothetical protein